MMKWYSVSGSHIIDILSILHSATENYKIMKTENRTTYIFLHHNSNAVYFEACHTLPWDIPLQTFFLSLLSLESICVCVEFFLVSNIIGKTERVVDWFDQS